MVGVTFKVGSVVLICYEDHLMPLRFAKVMEIFHDTNEISVCWLKGRNHMIWKPIEINWDSPARKVPIESVHRTAGVLPHFKFQLSEIDNTISYIHLTAGLYAKNM